MAKENSDRLIEDILNGLIQSLSQGAPSEFFSSQLARAESISSTDTRKATLVESARLAIAIRNRLDLQQQRERGLLAVIESAQDLSGHLELVDLLRTIVSRARNLLGSHVAWLSVYNPEIDKFQVLITDGALSEGTDKMTANRCIGVASVIMTTLLPFTTPDYLSDDRFPHDPALDKTFRIEEMAALVGVPLMSGNEFVGLLFVADRYNRSHTTSEVSILSTLATHAAVAIKNAKAFEVANTALKNAESARIALEQHTYNVQAAAEAHERLTSLLAQGASLSKVCQAVAELLDGSILVVDEAFQIISRGTAENYSEKGALSYNPMDGQSREIVNAVRESRKAGRSVIAYKNDDELCCVVPVIAGNLVVGTVLLFRQDNLTELSISIFERCSSVIGIVLLSQERLEIHKSRDVATLLSVLLLSHHYEPTLTQDRAQKFGLDLSQSLSLLLIETDDLKAAYVAKRLRANAAFSSTILDEIGGLVAIVLETRKVEDVLRICAGLAKRELGSNFRGVLSKPVSSAEALPDLYAVLRRALFVAKRVGVSGSILRQDELALYSVLFETQDEASLNAFLATTIGKLIAHDGRRGSDLTSTLLCYFDSGQNARLTAKCLDIHVNTVRQRLASIEEILGYWGNATRTLEIHMALRLWGLSKRGDLAAVSPVEL